VEQKKLHLQEYGVDGRTFTRTDGQTGATLNACPNFMMGAQKSKDYIKPKKEDVLNTVNSTCLIQIKRETSYLSMY